MLKATSRGLRSITFVASLVAVLVLAIPSNFTVAQSPENTGLPEVNGWRLAAALMQPRSEQAVAELDGKIYVLGGYPPGRIPSDVVQV